MAEILIKGMEMPKTCADCRFAIDSYGSLTECKCAVLGFGIYKYMTRGTKLERHDDCPLVALPEHSDLIDRDELLTDLADRICVDDMLDGIYEPAIDRIHEAKAILEAST